MAISPEAAAHIARSRELANTATAGAAAENPYASWFQLPDVTTPIEAARDLGTAAVKELGSTVREVAPQVAKEGNDTAQVGLVVAGVGAVAGLAFLGQILGLIDVRKLVK
jgi:hypothetical protein